MESKDNAIAVLREMVACLRVEHAELRRLAETTYSAFYVNQCLADANREAALKTRTVKDLLS